MSIETPKYDVLQKDGKFEIRNYQGYINASVEVESDFKSALNQGFGILADYIFGNNRAKTYIEMTAPVTSVKIGEGKRFRVSFTMPAKYDLEILPEPTNKEISINKVEPHKAAALNFSGYMSEKLTLRKTQELEAWLMKNNLQAKSGFKLAQYNPPWIPGPFRRNEIIVEV